MGRKDSEVIFIKRLEASFAVQTVFLLLRLSFTFMTSFVSRGFFFGRISTLGSVLPKREVGKFAN